MDWQRKTSKGIHGLKEMDLLAVASQVRNGTLDVAGGVKALEGLKENADIIPDENSRIQDSAFFKNGQALQDWAKEKFAPAKDYEGSLTRTVSEAFGTTVPFAAIGLIPGAGPVLGTVAGMAVSSGSQIEDAISKGATQEQIIEAARLGALPGISEQVPM